ncbi:hypothetical protein BJ912DRAFT_1095811, partial [Pholiota molesta]
MKPFISIHAQAVSRSLKMKRRRPASRGSWRPSRCGLFVIVVPPPPLHRNVYSTQSPGIAWADHLPRAHPGPAQNPCCCIPRRPRGARSHVYHVCPAVVVCCAAGLRRAVVHGWSIEGITARIALHCTPRSLSDHAPAAGLSSRNNRKVLSYGARNPIC